MVVYFWFTVLVSSLFVLEFSVSSNKHRIAYCLEYVWLLGLPPSPSKIAYSQHLNRRWYAIFFMCFSKIVLFNLSVHSFFLKTHLNFFLTPFQSTATWARVRAQINIVIKHNETDCCLPHCLDGVIISSILMLHYRTWFASAMDLPLNPSFVPVAVSQRFPSSHFALFFFHWLEFLSWRSQREITRTKKDWKWK